MLSSLLARLRQLVDVLQDCRELRNYIAAGGDQPVQQGLLARASAGAALHRDHGMAMLSAFAAALTVLVCCALWIASGWPDGAIAAQMSVVACCIFAAQDDPVPAILGFIRAAIGSLVVVAVYLFAVLPAIDGFPMLVLMLAPILLTMGVLMTKPRWVGTAVALAVNAERHHWSRGPRAIDHRHRRSEPSAEAHSAGTDGSVVGGEAARPHGGRRSRGQPAGGVALAAAVRGRRRLAA